MLWSPGTGEVMRLCSFTASGSVSGITGNAVIAEKSYDYNAVNASIGAVTDINNPDTTGGWTTLVNLTGGPLMVVFVPGAINKNKIAGIGYDKSETLFSSRLQMLIDNVVVADLKASPGLAVNEAAAIQALPLAVDSGGIRCGFYPLYCEGSFTVRAARQGTATKSTDTLYVAAINYAIMERE